MDAAERERVPSWWWLVAVVLVAAAARLLHIASFDVWTDELHTMQIARSGEYSFGPAYKTAPLNFILTAWAMRAFGDQVVVARAIPLIAGLLTVPLFALLFARWVGRRAALIGAAVLALSTWHVYWSQNARHFALTTLLVMIGLHGFLAYWKEHRWWGAVLAPAALLAALFTHSSAGFYLAAMMAFVGGSLLWSLLRSPAGGPSPRHHLLALSALTIALVVYLPAYLSVGKYLLGNVAPWNPAWNIVGSLAFYVPSALAVFAVAGLAFLAAERDSTGWLYASCLVVPILLLTFASNFTTASAAYYLPSLLIIALLAGVAGDRLLRAVPASGSAATRLAVALVVAAVLAGEAMELALYHTYYRGLKPRWADASHYLESHRQPGDLILAAEADVVAYYLGSHDGIGWVDKYTQDLSSPGVPRRPGGGVWYAVYTSTGSVLALPESATRHLEAKAVLKRVFQMSYGPKDRTIALFYEAPAVDR
ncbi:MAG: glycosyltransferase family 39 protein [Gemmatimonadetes bacterium]|nr:glycosyltransferase family 39 protein [Gemmatimonadota bacterium]